MELVLTLTGATLAGLFFLSVLDSMQRWISEHQAAFFGMISLVALLYLSAPYFYPADVICQAISDGFSYSWTALSNTLTNWLSIVQDSI